MEETKSYWLESTPATNYPALDQDISVDAAVIGGGLAGISTAWLLKQEGLRVAVLEADRVCQGTTGHSTAKITSQHDLIYAWLDKEFGREKAQQYAEANEIAIKSMADIVETQKIDCDFLMKPAYVYTEQDKYVEDIQKEAKIAAELGIAAEYVQDPGLPFAVKAALRFDSQAQFHPRKYVLALAQAIPGEGCELYENTKVLGIEEGSINTISTDRGKNIRADKVVLATHFPIHDALGFYFARMYAERSYILGVRAEGKLPEGMFISAESSGHSLRTQAAEEGELLLVGGEHHKTGAGEEEPHYQKLIEFARSNFAVSDIPYRWSAQDYTTVDKIPYIGCIRKGIDNMFVATGFRKWGISTSLAAALIIRDLIIWGSSPWQDVFSPQRGLSLKSTGKLISINADVAKELVVGKLAGADQGQVQPGEAKVVSGKGTKIGVYRDTEDKLHKVDITCTHFGCELKWNSAESTWDCPCHGSRFSPDGSIVDGPALKPLSIPGGEESGIDPDII
ncbi:MAG: FAD-dependent oxidoreductase [Eubacteriales bacterium]|jgi:glycine/D-amino acid oxidase-like deaminating enzyme/nitrite reductase/ring-hydroxylating ferredoxin subunit|nr:FAD-dependent oxidoreductase [Eubacteriales bacterium]